MPSGDVATVEFRPFAARRRFRSLSASRFACGSSRVGGGGGGGGGAGIDGAEGDGIMHIIDLYFLKNTFNSPFSSCDRVQL